MSTFPLPQHEISHKFWLPMIVVRKRKLSGREITRNNREKRRQARAERNAKIIKAYLAGRSVDRLSVRYGVKPAWVREILHKANVFGMGGHHIRMVKAAQFEELERLCHKHRHTLPPGFRSAGEVMARLHLQSLTTAG